MADLEPSGLQIDSQTALDYLTNHDIMSKTKIVSTAFFTFTFDFLKPDKMLYGQSIGGAVSIDLASKNTKTVCLLPCRDYSLVNSCFRSMR